MRPLQLTISAFGPYKEREVIDFTKLQDHHLFLITGATGSGKTSIFDAICYALYGETSGTDRPERSIRCQNASLDFLTEVEFSFRLHSKEYRVQRKPKQEQPKKRGEGVTEVPGDALLYLPGVETPVTGLKNVTDKITELIGLELSQFRQIMMIPQGEFRKLLVAKSDERTEILKRIFKTHLYGDLQRKFKEKSRLLEDKIKLTTEQRKEEIHKLQYDAETETGRELEAELRAEFLSFDRILRLTNTQIEKDIESEGLLLSEKKSEEEKRDRLITRKGKAEDNNQKLKALEKLNEELGKLENEQVAITGLETEIGIMEKVEKIRPVKEAYRQRKDEAEEKAKALTADREMLEKLTEEVESLEEEKKTVTAKEYKDALDGMKARAGKLRDYLTVLGDVKEIQEAYQAEKSLSDQAKKAHEDLLTEVQECQGEIAANEKTLEQLKDTDKEFYEKNRELQQVENLLSGLEKVIRGTEEIEKLEKKKAQKEEALDGAKNKETEAETRVKTRKQRYHQNQAALLAKELQTEVPCPVCGSTEHPAPATLSEEACTLEDVEKAEDAYSKARKSLTDAQLAFENARTNVRHQQKELESDLKALKDPEKSKEREELINLLEKEDNFLNPQKDPEKFKQNQQALIAYQKTTNEHKEELLLGIEKVKENQKISESASKKLASKKKALEALQEQAEKAAKALQEKMTSLNTLDTKLKTRLEEVPGDLREEKSLREKISHTEKELAEKEQRMNKVVEEYQKKYNRKNKKASAVEEGEKELKVRAQKEQAEKEKYDQALTEQELTEEEFLFYLEKLPKKPTLEKQVKEYYETLHGTKSSIKQQKSNITSFETEDIEAYNQEIHKLNEILTEKQNLLETVKLRKRGNEAVVVKVEELNFAIAKEEKEYRTVGHLAEVIGGKNRENLPFERYILRSYLSDVLRVANHRFEPMTGGRYALKLAEGVEDKRTSAGLDLEVFDRYTGLPRSVKTLSGGESFKASLSMALGLAEVVQSHAGGIMLDTVFIDEGFGTLDQESLDSAINCLIDLQDAGRLVGIISHVEELKERIQAQLIVEGDETGSRADFRVP